MLLGVPSQLFRGSPAQVAAALRQHGLSCVQLSPGFPHLRFHEPGQITTERCRAVAEPFHCAGIRVAALSSFSHLMEPDLDRRHVGIVRLYALIRHCRDFGTDRIVTETGSLCAISPWLSHPPNRSENTRAELLLILQEALRLAADHGVTLLLKPGPTHVLASLEDALRLREQLDHPRLGFVLDAANFLLESTASDLTANLRRLVERLGPWAPLVHAADLRFGADGPSMPRVGRGVLDYGLLLKLLGRHQPELAVILQHLRPEEVAEARIDLLRLIGQA